jgi:N-methylhydantoinase A
MTARLGFDIGGTFTDLLLVDDETGTVVREKVPTTPPDFWRGAVEGVEKLLESAAVEADAVGHVSHGTTVATNALLEGEGVTTGLITTDGFRDVIAIGREKRSEIYDLAPEAPPTFTERRNRHGVDERVSADGEVLRPLDEADATAALDALEAAGVESVAVALLHAYANDEHERRIAALAADRDLAVSCSSEVMGEIKEYERTLSTVINAHLGPIADRYVDTLSEEIRDLGIDRTLHLMQANGGVATPETIPGRQLRLINSGPAAGVLGAKRLAGASGVEDIITLDMGGTSTDTCLVREGTPETTTEGEIQGIPLLFPQIDVRSIGAGGGSIAWLDRGGTLKVGPKSAGARPGPACYGRGGTDPTVTDAALILGYLNPDYFLGGEMNLDESAAEAALDTLADRLRMDRLDLADGIVEIVTTDMTRGIRLVTVENGYDPRSFALTCFGGAGPLFATRLASELDIERTIVPRAPGVLSTFGLVTADRRFDFSASDPLVLDRSNADDVAAVYTDLEAQARDVAGADATIRRRADVRYLGQTFKLTVDAPEGPVNGETVAAIRDRFLERYESIYGHVSEDDAVEAVTWRLEALDETPTFDPGAPAAGETVAGARKGHRDAYADGTFIEHDVYDRTKLPTDERVAGPAIVEEPESTTLIGPDATFRVDVVGNLLVDQ